MNTARRTIMLGMAASCCLPGHALAASDRLPADQAVLVLLRALAYDRNLQERAGADVTVGVLFSENDPTSSRTGKALHRAIDALGDQTIGGLPLRGVRLPYKDIEVVREWVHREGISALLVSMPVKRVPGIVALTRQEQVASMAVSRQHVVAGISLGVALVGQKLRLFVNRAASRAEGLDLSAKLLRFAEVVG